MASGSQAGGADSPEEYACALQACMSTILDEHRILEAADHSAVGTRMDALAVDDYWADVELPAGEPSETKSGAEVCVKAARTKGTEAVSGGCVTGGARQLPSLPETAPCISSSWRNIEIGNTERAEESLGQRTW